MQSNPNAMVTMTKNSIFTNVALTDDGDVWWEGMDGPPPAHAIDWQGKDWTPDCGRPAAHPNARFTAPASQCPSIDPDWENPAGVPISAFIFGGRAQQGHAAGVPGVQLGARRVPGRHHGLGDHRRGHRRRPAMRRDPMAMLPFCGYNMADYFTPLAQHRPPGVEPAAHLPRQLVPQGRRTASSSGRASARTCACSSGSSTACTAAAMAVESPIGWMPRYEDIDWNGLDFSSAAFYDLMAVGRDAGTAEAHSHEELFDRFRDRLPKEFIFERELLRSRLWRSPERWELAHEA